MQGQRSSEFWFMSGILTCQALFGALSNAKFRRRYGKVPLHSVEEVEDFVRKNYRMSLDHYWQHHRFDKADRRSQNTGGGKERSQNNFGLLRIRLQNARHHHRAV